VNLKSVFKCLVLVFAVTLCLALLTSCQGERESDERFTSPPVSLPEPIKDLSIVMKAGNIKIVPTTDPEMSYTIRAPAYDRYIVEIKEGESMSIEFNDNGTRLRLGQILRNIDQITVYVPENMVFDSVDLHTYSGNITVEDNLDAHSLSVDSVSGVVDINGLALNLPDGCDLNVKSVSGNVDVRLSFLSALKLDVTSGDVTITTHYLDQFTVTANSTSGTVTKDGANVVTGMGSGTSGTGPKQMTIDLMSGNVELLGATRAR